TKWRSWTRPKPVWPPLPKALDQRRGFIWLLCAMAALTALSIDIILPATSVIARDLSVDERYAALTIGAYLIGYGLGQLVWGLISDAYGRSPALVWSLAGFLAASVGCAFATDYWLLVGLRFAQGMCAGAPVMARAIARDIASGPRLGEILSLQMILTTIAPLFAPLLGVALTTAFGWRANFLFLVLFSGLLLILWTRLGHETVPHRRPERLRLSFVREATRTLFAKPAFVQGLFASAAGFAGYASLLSLGAVVAEEAYGLGPTGFGPLFVLAALGLSLGIGSYRLLVRRLGENGLRRLMQAGMVAAVLVHGAFWIAPVALVPFWSAVCFYTLVFGLLLPWAQARAMQVAEETPGFAASLLGAVVMAGGAVGAALATVLFTGTAGAISGTMMLGGVVALLFLWRAV
ncbi:MAG: MFS transporter, partial [Pseudomonadota bacterium]